MSINPRQRRMALNLGTAVWLGENRVRFVWPCGCTQVAQMSTGPARLSPQQTCRLVYHWRINGAQLHACELHPTFYDPKSKFTDLNDIHPQEK